MTSPRHPSLCENNPYVAPSVTGAEEVPYFAGYLGQVSVGKGESLVAHVATRSSAPCFVHVYRVVGCKDATLTPRLEHVTTLGEIEPVRYPRLSVGSRLGPGDADSEGCRWPAQTLLRAVPEDWRSGIYVAQFSAGRRPLGEASATLGSDALFIVRPQSTTRHAPMLYRVNVGTWGAYHLWRNRSLYLGRTDQGVRVDELRAFRASFRRPGVGLGLPNETILSPAPPKASYAFAFIDWLERNSHVYDVCSGLDIGSGVIDLEPYSVVVSAGHDEYWTADERRQLIEFRARGGHVVFLGGNLAYWQIRDDPAAGMIECYKRASTGEPQGEMDGVGEPLDPHYPATLGGARDITVQTWSLGASTSTIELTGVYSANRRPKDPSQIVYGGAMWWWEEMCGPSRPTVPFVVTKAEHWAFVDTGLSDGDSFGASSRIVGHEVDGLEVTWTAERPELTFNDGALPGTNLLAVADCRTWGEVDYGTDPPLRVTGRRVSPAAVGGVATMICHEGAEGGILFTAPTTNWVLGLVNAMDWSCSRTLDAPVLTPESVVEKITANVIAACLRSGNSDSSRP